MGFMVRSRSLRRKNSNINGGSGEDGDYFDDFPMSPDNKGLRIAVDREVTQTSTRVTPVSTRQPFQYPGSTRPSTDYGRDEDLPIEFTSEDFTFRHPSSGPPSRGRSPIRHGDATIGIALGSPRVLSPQAQAQREAVRPSPLASSQSVSVFEVPPDYWAEPGPRTKRVLKKQKSTPWKSVFGKGHPERAMTEPNYSTSVVALPNKEATSPPPLPSLQALPIRPPTAGHVKRESQTRGMTRQMIRAEMDRAAFEKALAYSNAAHPSPPESLQPGQGATTTQSQAAPVRQALLRTESAPVLPQAGVPSPLLNVEIPTAEMERYSVMFEKLQRQPQTILERRRGSLTKLRPVVEETSKLSPDDAASRVPQRRATSPSMPRGTSPALVDHIEASVVHAANTQSSSLESVQPRIQRSYTEPVKALDGSGTQHELTVPHGLASDSQVSPIWSEASLPPTPGSAGSKSPPIVEEEATIMPVAQSVVRSLPRIEETSLRNNKSRVGARANVIPIHSSGGGRIGSAGVKLAATGGVQVSMARQVSLSRRPMQKPITISKAALKPQVVDTRLRKSTLVTIEHS